MEPDPTNILKESDAGPKLVARAFAAPGKCAVTGDIDGPFIDSGTETAYGWLYLHAPWVEQVARDLLGMVPASEVDDLQSAFEDVEAELRDEISELRNRAEALQKIEDARELVAAAEVAA